MTAPCLVMETRPPQDHDDGPEFDEELVLWFISMLYDFDWEEWDDEDI